MLDHLAQGRLNFGIAATGLPSDWALCNVDGTVGQNRAMTREALDIILRLWSDEPECDYQGTFWHVTKPGTRLHTLAEHRRLCWRARMRSVLAPGACADRAMTV